MGAFMAEESPGSITQAFAKLQSGDPTAVRQLWERFFPRLLALSRATLAGRPQRVADATDAAQSAFLSFWHKATRGELAAALDRNDLWNLLGLITVRKAKKQVRREAAQKRGGGQVL